MRNEHYTSDESLHLAWFVIALILLLGTYEIWVSHRATSALRQFDRAISTEASR